MAGMVIVDGRDVPWRDGLTVADLVPAGTTRPGSLFADIDGKLVPGREWATRPVPDGARVRFHPIGMGG